MTSDDMASHKQLLGKVYKMVPPMLEKFHKGKRTSLYSIVS